MVKAILLDIEGTLSSISYVKDVMFPYSKKKLKQFLEENRENEKVKQIIKQVEDIEGKKLSLEEVAQILEKWIDEDKKVTPLKELQGLIWKEGFESGELKGHLYEDAYKKLKEWKDKGYKLYIYSSGSVGAQKLYFSHSEYGNILDLFSGHFDTKIGNKKEQKSYEKIAKEIGLKPEEILFLTDNPDEVKAAEKAGMKAIRIVRPEDSEYIQDFPYPQMKNLEEVESVIKL